MMDGGGGNLTITWIPDDFPQFVSPEYKQMRHISVTLWAQPYAMNATDVIYVRAYFDKGDGTIAKVPVLVYNPCDFYPRNIEFDARQWDILGDDADQSGDFPAYFTYTTIYPVMD